MVTEWKLLFLINTEQYVYCFDKKKKILLFLDLSFSFRMKPFWMLLVDCEETIEKYTSTMWQLSAKVPSWLATRGSSSTTLARAILSHTTTVEKCGMDFSPSSGEATSGENKFPYESRVACHEWQIGKFTMPHFSSVVVCHNYTVSVNLALIKLNSNHLYCRCYFHNTYSWHLYCRCYFHNTYSWQTSTVGVMS